MAAVKWSLVVPAVLGIAAGVFSSLIVSRMSVPATPSDGPSSQPRETFVPVVFEQPAPAASLDDLHRRVAALEKPALAPPPVARTLPDDPALRERERNQTIARHEESIRNHKQQPIDPTWSQAAAAALRSDLTQLADSSGFSIVEVDCRTTSCTSTLEWPSYGSALLEWQKLLHHPYQSNCSREITLAEPPNGEARYQATAVFDCETSRVEGR